MYNFLCKYFNKILLLSDSTFPDHPILKNSEEDIIAQASCNSLTGASHWIYAVRRDCSKEYDDCNAVCQSSSLKIQDSQISGKT